MQALQMRPHAHAAAACFRGPADDCRRHARAAPPSSVPAPGRRRVGCNVAGARGCTFANGGPGSVRLRGGKRGALRRAPRAAAASRAAAADGAGGGWGPFAAGELGVESEEAGVGYRVQRLLGVGASSHTYECEVERAGVASGERVALKAVRAARRSARRAEGALLRALRRR